MNAWPNLAVSTSDTMCGKRGPHMDGTGFTRREFAVTAAAALAATGELAAQNASAALDLAEWSYFWIGVERADLARGTVVNGRQMYVEYMTPVDLRHPYPIVMVHGGGGQGTDWLGTPDGRPGWAHYFVREGYAVYVVDRPGHGRSPFNPDIDGPFPRGAQAYEQVERQFTAPEKAEKPYAECAKLHTQWPGTGTIGDPTVDQVVAGQGGSFLADLEATHEVWRHNMSLLLDKIGPAIIMDHSMGGPNGWIVGDARPMLVKGIIGVEPAGGPFGNLKWGLTANKVAYEPPAHDASELKTKKITSSNPGEEPCLIQEEPARKLVNLKNIPIAIVTSEASYHVAYDWGSVAYLRQAGCTVEHIRLAEHGIHGNAHFLMMEKNNREALQPILDWIPKAVEKQQPVRPVRSGETALKLADMGFFWVGTERRKMPYGTIQAGQMYVQYNAGTGAASLPRRIGAWRWRTDVALHGSRRWEGRLGALLCAGGLQGLPRRQAGAWARAISSGRAWADWGKRVVCGDHSGHGSVRVRPKQAMAGDRRNRGSAGGSADGGSQLRSTRQRDGAQAMGEPWSGVAGEDWACDYSGALGGRTVQLDCGE
jgi:pimeloyl-ACP methyl ester carboxylesterase